VQCVCGVTRKVRDRLEAIASTPEACAPQTPHIPYHDTNASTVPHCFRGIVFYRPACGSEPASRDFHPNRDRDDAGGSEFEFYRILAFSIAISAAEAAVGLAMVITVYRHFRTTNVDQYDQLKG
jgi:hypothetical protein